MYLTDKEKQSIRVLNYAATFDGIIESEEEIRYILNQGINKFIAPIRHNLVRVTEIGYPIKIVIR